MRAPADGSLAAASDCLRDRPPSALRGETREWALRVGLPAFVDSFTRRALAERPADLRAFLQRYAAEGTPGRPDSAPSRCPLASPAAAPLEQQPPLPARTQSPRGAQRLPPLTSPVALPAIEPLRPALASPKGGALSNTSVRFPDPPLSTAPASPPAEGLAAALSAVAASVRKQMAASSSGGDLLLSFFTKACEAVLEAASRIEEKGIPSMPPRAITDILSKGVTAAATRREQHRKKKAGIAMLQGKICGMLAAGAFMQRTAGRGRRSLPALAAAPSKFDATDQVRGRSNRDDGEVGAPQRIEYFSQLYRPHKDPCEVVSDLRGWHDPKGRLWPVGAVQRLLRNCRLMVERHSLGEPREVVVPLFTYSSFLFHEIVWSVWVPVQNGGKWVSLAPDGPWENSHGYLQPGATELDLSGTGCGDALDKIVQGKQRKDDSDESAQDSVVFPDTLELMLSGGLPLDASPVQCVPYWGGLQVWRGRNQAQVAVGLHRSGSVWSSQSSGEGSPMEQVPFGFECPTHVYLVRLATPKEQLGTSLCPLQDVICWLPTPESLHECTGPEKYTLTRGSSVVTRAKLRGEDDCRSVDSPTLQTRVQGMRRLSGLSAMMMRQLSNASARSMSPRGSQASRASRMSRASVRSPKGGSKPQTILLEVPLCGLDDGDIHVEVPGSPGRESAEPPQAFPQPNVASMYRYPPPGVLEYIFSRRSDEELFRRDRSTGEDLFRVRQASTRSEELISLCYYQKNQQQYSDRLHKMLVQMLDTNEASLGDLQTSVLRQIVLLKTGEDCEPAAKPDQSRRASVLTDDSALTADRGLQMAGEHAIRPTPLAIAHSLDLQKLVWLGEEWFIAFSGKPYAVASDALGCIPWFRLRVPFEDQPYASLNTAMRNLSFGKTATALDVNQGDRKVTKGKRRKGYPEELLGRYHAAQRGDQYGALTTDVALENPWQLRFAQPPRLGTQIEAVWDDPAEREWRCGAEGAAAGPSERAPYEHSARGAAEGGAWKVTARNAFASGTGAVTTVASSDAELDVGTWMMCQVRPLLWQIANAMKSLRPVVGGHRCSPIGRMKLYRGLQNVSLDPKVYARGMVVLWGQYSSSSKDQGVAQSFAGGAKASVFTLDGSTCRLIAPWSRFGREEEWLFPLNTLWEVTALLTDEQRQILAKSDTQLYEMREVVSDIELYILQVRSVLGTAPTAAAAAIVFQAEHALRGGGGFLNLTLKRADEGSTPVQWSYGTKVCYDASGRCPVQTSTQLVACNKQAAEVLAKYIVRGRSGQTVGLSAACSDQISEGKFTADTFVGQTVLGALAKIMGIARPDSAEVTKHSASAVEMKVHNSLDLWEVLITVRRQSQRQGIAIKDDGAELLAKIISQGVPLVHIDVTNNDVQQRGADALLSALRRNPKVLQLKVDSSSVLSNIQHSQACPLSELRCDLPPLSLDETVQAINIRCLQHQGRISYDRLLAFGPGWPSAAAAALYDLRQLDVDFSGLFRHDADGFTTATETFVVKLAKQCIGACRKHMGPPQFPHLRGALVAACISAPARVVELLLDMGADVTETGDWGETASVKARRRAQGSSPIPAEIQRRLYTKHSLVKVRPNFSSVDAETWRLKNVALIAMRVWDDKVAAGFNVVDELVLNLHFPQPCSWEQKLKVLSSLAKRVVRSASAQESSLGKIPVDRAKVSILCYIMFCCSGEQVNELLAEVYNDKVYPETRVIADPDQLRNEDVRDTLSAAIRTLHNPRAWGSAGDLNQMRERLGRWACIWALLNCTLCSCAETNRDAPVWSTLTAVPASAFYSFLSLRQGDTHTVADPVAWHPFEVEQDNDAGADGNEAQRMSLRCGDAADACTAVSFRMSGRFRGQDVTPLHRLATHGFFARQPTTAAISANEGDIACAPTHLLLPAFMSYLVADQRFDAETSALHLTLISRGTLLDSDPELIAWRQRVLLRAERTEGQLGHEREGAALQRLDTDRQLVRWTTRMDESQARTGPALTEAYAALQDARHRSILRHRVVEEGGSMVVAAHSALRMPRPAVLRAVAPAAAALAPCPPPALGTVCGCTGSPRWQLQSLRPTEGLPHTKRPARALLAALGRKKGTLRPLRSEAIPAVQLETALLDRSDYKAEVEVHADAIECEHASSAQQGFADAAWADRTGDPDGPPAAAVFGDGVFRITIGEVQQLLRSTRLTIMPDRMPLLFVLSLIRRFCFAEDHAAFMIATRHSPLGHITEDSAWLHEREAVLDAMKSSTQAAPGDLRTVRSAAAAAALAEDAELLQDYRKIQKTRDLLRKWESQVRSAPGWFGFSSTRQVGVAFAKSVAECATEVCLSQRGYFLTHSGGPAEQRNQLCAKTESPVVFLAVSGIDFAEPLSTMREAPKYFERNWKVSEAHLGWTRWRTNGEQALRQRIRKIFETVFTAARDQGVRNLSATTPGLSMMGCITDPGLLWAVEQIYFETQFELLCAEDWGFENYYLSINSEGRHVRMVREVLQHGLREGGPYNNAPDGLMLHCNVALHEKCPKALAQELSQRGTHTPGYLVPCAGESVMFGLLGMHWETGREETWSAEEDWAATSTGVLGTFGISAKAVGLHDVVLELASGKKLCVSRLDAEGEGGIICSIDDDNGERLYYGPFRAIRREPEAVEIFFFNDTSRGSGFVNKAVGQHSWELDRVKTKVLQPLLLRLVTLARRSHVACHPEDLGTGAELVDEMSDEGDSARFAWIRATGHVGTLPEAVQMAVRFVASADIRKVIQVETVTAGGTQWPGGEQGNQDHWIVLELSSPAVTDILLTSLAAAGCDVGSHGNPQASPPGTALSSRRASLDHDMLSESPSHHFRYASGVGSGLLECHSAL